LLLPYYGAGKLINIMRT